MIAQEIARRYARALFMSTQEKGLLDTVFEQLGDLGEHLDRDPSLLDFLNDPRVPEDDKRALVRDVFSGRTEKIIVEFLIVLIDKTRIGFLPIIIDEFIRLVEAEKGIGRVTVISSVPLNQAEKPTLIEKLAAKTGLKIELEEKIDPTILGGMIVILHNEIIDGSVRHELDLIKERLNKVRVH